LREVLVVVLVLEAGLVTVFAFDFVVVVFEAGLALTDFFTAAFTAAALASAFLSADLALEVFFVGAEVVFLVVAAFFVVVAVFLGTAVGVRLEVAVVLLAVVAAAGFLAVDVRFVVAAGAFLVVVAFVVVVERDLVVFDAAVAGFFVAEVVVFFVTAGLTASLVAGTLFFGANLTFPDGPLGKWNRPDSAPEAIARFS
jgi:hypothetical protein